MIIINNILKYFLTSIIFIILSGISFAAYNFDNYTSFDNFLQRFFNEVHIIGGDSSFGGIFIVTKLKELSSSENLSLYPSNFDNVNNFNGVVSEISCDMKLRGFYHNPQVSSTNLYPIDNETYNAWNGSGDVNFMGGFYTDCEPVNYSTGVAGESIFGYVKYKNGSNEIFDLTAGYLYDQDDNKPKYGSGFANTFQFRSYDNRESSGTPIGLIYTSDGGVSFVGGEVKSGIGKLINLKYINQNIENVTSNELIFTDSNINIERTIGVVNRVLGLLGGFNISESNNTKQGGIDRISRQSQQGGGSSRGFNIGGNVTNVGKLSNNLTKTVEKKCKGKWINNPINLPSFDTSLNSGWGKTHCIKGNDVKISSNGPNNSGLKAEDDTMIIIKNGDLIFNTNVTGKGQIDAFVNEGFIGIKNNIDLVEIDGSGNCASSLYKGCNDSNTTVTSGAYINANLYARGLIGGYNSSDKLTGFNHKLYINGSLSTYNTVSDNASNERKQLGASYCDECNTSDVYIGNIFQRNCTEEQKGSDGVICGTTNDDRGYTALIVKGALSNTPLIGN